MYGGPVLFVKLAEVNLHLVSVSLSIKDHLVSACLSCPYAEKKGLHFLFTLGSSAKCITSVSIEPSF